MPSVCPGVDFENIAREWRCKYSPDNDKLALQNAQKLFETVVDQLKALTGFVSLQPHRDSTTPPLPSAAAGAAPKRCWHTWNPRVWAQCHLPTHVLDLHKRVPPPPQHCVLWVHCQQRHRQHSSKSPAPSPDQAVVLRALCLATCQKSSAPICARLGPMPYCGARRRRRRTCRDMSQ